MPTMYVLQYENEQAAYGWKVRGCYGTKAEFVNDWLFLGKEEARVAARPGDRVMPLDHPEVRQQLIPRLKAWESGHHE